MEEISNYGFLIIIALWFISGISIILLAFKFSANVKSKRAKRLIRISSAIIWYTFYIYLGHPPMIVPNFLVIFGCALGDIAGPISFTCLYPYISWIVLIFAIEVFFTIRDSVKHGNR